MDTDKDEKEKKRKPSGFMGKLKQIKHIEVIFALLACAVLLLVYSGFSAKNKSTTKAVAVDSPTIEKQLQEILSSISGVGKTKVMITYKGGKSVEIAFKEETETTISDDGNKVVVENKNPIIVNQNGENVPIILKENLPEIEGVVVVAEGGDKVDIKFQITQAICVALSIDSSKINVFLMK